MYLTKNEAGNTQQDRDIRHREELRIVREEMGELLTHKDEQLRSALSRVAELEEQLLLARSQPCI